MRRSARADRPLRQHEHTATDSPSPCAGIRDMLRQIFHNGRVTDPSLVNAVVIGSVGLGFLIAEFSMLSWQGHRGAATPLMAILLASAASSNAGLAFSALCGAVLFLLVDNPVDAVQVMIVCSIAIQVFSVATLWRSIDWHSLPVFLIGGILGVPVGVYFLLHLPADTYREMLGVLLIGYGCWLLPRWPVSPLQTGPLADACAGFLGGFTGGLAGLPGAFIAIWCGFKDWDEPHQRAVHHAFTLCIQPVSLVVILLMRPASSITTQPDWKTLAFIPLALLGVWLGLRVFKRLSDRRFELVANLLVVFAGIGLVI